MVENRKKFKILIMVMLLFYCFSIFAWAINVSEVNNEVLQESVLPNDLNFAVSDTCSHHKFFRQATARQDGTFATCTVGVYVDNLRSDTNKKFIDIYNSNGEFIEELSFETSSDLAIELTEQTLNIYLYSERLCYDLESKKVSYYLTAHYEAYNSGYVETLRRDKFTVGEWTYSYKSTILGHTQLIRSNGSEKQTLLEMQGSKLTDAKYVVVDILFFVLFFVLIKFVCKKYKRQQTNQENKIEKTIRGRFND